MHKAVRLLTFLLVALAAPLAAQQAYLIDSNLDRLFTVDLTTGAATFVASTNNNTLSTPADLTWRADTQELWTIDLAGGAVGTVDVMTGTFTAKFQTALSGWQGMTFIPATGNYLLANQNGSNYMLNPSTGVTTLLGAAGFSLITALDVDPAGVVWGVDFTSGAVVTVNTTTGAATRVSTTLTNMQGLGITAAGVFYITSTSTQSLYRLDPMTGTATLIGAHGAGVQFAKGFDIVDGGCFAAKSGQGCKDSGNTVLDMHWSGKPCINQAFQVGTTTSASWPFYLLVLGISDQKAGGIPLPFDLGPIGAPGCKIYSSQELVFSLAQSQDLNLPIPNNPTLDGLKLYFQGLVLDPRINTLGVASSNLLTVGIGK